MRRKNLTQEQINSFTEAMYSNIADPSELEPWREASGSQRGHRNTLRVAAAQILRKEGCYPLPSVIGGSAVATFISE